MCVSELREKARWTGELTKYRHGGSTTTKGIERAGVRCSAVTTELTVPRYAEPDILETEMIDAETLATESCSIDLIRHFMFSAVTHCCFMS
jgi:hypothetical protein